MALLRHLFKNARRVVKFVGGSSAIARRYSTSRWAILWRAGRVFYEKGFAPWEAQAAGLLASGIPEGNYDACIGKFRLMQFQRRINPIALDYLVSDKAVFYAHCAGLGLPVPALYCVFVGNKGRDFKGRVLDNVSDWEQFVEELLPQEFVIKPARSAYGHGVNVYVRKTDVLIDSSGLEVSPRQIYEGFSSHSHFRKFIVTERLHGHPELVQLSNTPYLQTVRLTTFVNEDGVAQVYNAFLKVIAGNRPVDNFENGLTGNLFCPVDLESGAMDPGLSNAPDALGSFTVPRHPRTDIVFHEQRVPMWAEATSLACRAAIQFLPLRTIGWDVGITPAGPVLVEGNTRYDPSNRVALMSPEGSTTTKMLAKLFELLERDAGIIRSKEKS